MYATMNINPSAIKVIISNGISMYTNKIARNAMKLIGNFEDTVNANFSGRA